MYVACTAVFSTCGASGEFTQAPGTHAVKDDQSTAVTTRLTNAPSIVMVGEKSDVPAASDAEPRLSLAFRLRDGRLIPIEGEAASYAPFRNGVALVDEKRRLVFITPDGTRRVLARESGAPPVRGPKGELVYVAKYCKGAEIHVLEVQGNNRIVAEGFDNAGLLAPQSDGRLFFVAATNGGVAGLWTVDDVKIGGGRCLTNCDLRTGERWDDRFIPVPGDAASIRVIGDEVQWKTPEGEYRCASLSTRDSETCHGFNSKYDESDDQRDPPDSQDQAVRRDPLGKTP